jgi:hypothetical protein
LATVQTKRGETVRLSPKLTPQVSAPKASPMLTQAAKPPAEPERAWFHNPWVWVLAGGVAAAGVTAALVSRSTADGKSDPVFGVTQTLISR